MVLKDLREWISEKEHKLWVNLFLIAFSGIVANKAYGLGLGNFGSPGPGFMSFGASCLLGLLALHLFLKSLFSREHRAKLILGRKGFGRIASVLVAITIYILLLEPVGYLLSTFFIMGFLFGILGGGKWVSGLIGAALCSFLSYVLFSYGLGLQFPKGVIRFF